MNPETTAILDQPVLRGPLKLWVDDLKDPIIADTFGLEAEGWTWVKTSQEAMPYLFGAMGQQVLVLALDNDLGHASDFDGRDIATALLNRTLDDPTFKPPVWMHCISFNPVAEDAIRRTFEDIKRVVIDR